MILEIFALGVFLLLTTVNFLILSGVPWFLPVRLFIIFNFVMCAGILVQLDFNVLVDRSHAFVIFISSLSYLLGSFLFSMRAGLRRLASGVSLHVGGVTKKIDFQLSLIFYLFSGAMVAIYFILLGRNVFLTAITSSLSSSDVVDMRLASYAGENYYAPGYFNQFKNILFPASFFSLAFYVWRSRRSLFRRCFVILLLLIPVLMGLVGTGQRGYLFSFLVSIILFLGILGSDKASGVRIGLKGLLLSFSVFFLLFSASSYLLGRAENFSLLDLFSALIVRIFNDNQYSAVVGFGYVYDQSVQFGAEWLTDFLGILPGDDFRGSNLANKIHAVIYGSERGTAPVSMWGSVFYNWGWFGIAVFPLVLSAIYVVVSRGFLKNRRLTIFSAAGYSYLFFVLGGWVASGPMQLINNGLATAILLLGIIKSWRATF